MTAEPVLDGPWQRPDRALLTVRRVAAATSLGVPGLALSVVAGLVAGPPGAAAGLLVTGGAVGIALVVVRRGYLATGWAERGDDLLVRRGVVVRRTTVVPYGRMQYVDVVAGPLDRRLGIATVVLHTAAAASDAAVPGLREADARRLRDRLAALGEARAAGL